MLLKNANEVELYAMLENRAMGYRGSEKSEFLSELWRENFAKYEVSMPTGQAIEWANWVENFANRVWDELN